MQFQTKLFVNKYFANGSLLSCIGSEIHIKCIKNIVCATREGHCEEWTPYYQAKVV